MLIYHWNPGINVLLVVFWPELKQDHILTPVVYILQNDPYMFYWGISVDIMLVSAPPKFCICSCDSGPYYGL